MTRPKLLNDAELVKTETPQEQVDRMGNGWVSAGQYEKQLLLPLHLEKVDAKGNPAIQLRELERDGTRKMVPVYETVCGLVLTEVTLRTTGNPDLVTCQACAEEV